MPLDSDSQEERIKVVFIGDGAVGKSSLLFSLRDSVCKTEPKDYKTTCGLKYESKRLIEAMKYYNFNGGSTTMDTGDDGRLIDAMKYSIFNGGTTTMDTGDHYISDNTRTALADLLLHPSVNSRRKRMENKLRDYTKLLFSVGVILSAQQGSVLLDHEDALDALNTSDQEKILNMLQNEITVLENMINKYHMNFEYPDRTEALKANVAEILNCLGVSVLMRKFHTDWSREEAERFIDGLENPCGGRWLHQLMSYFRNMEWKENMTFKSSMTSKSNYAKAGYQRNDSAVFDKRICGAVRTCSFENGSYFNKNKNLYSNIILV